MGRGKPCAGLMTRSCSGAHGAEPVGSVAQLQRTGAMARGGDGLSHGFEQVPYEEVDRIFSRDRIRR